MSSYKKERERERERVSERERLVNISKYVTKRTGTTGPGNQMLKKKNSNK